MKRPAKKKSAPKKAAKKPAAAKRPVAAKRPTAPKASAKATTAKSRVPPAPAPSVTPYTPKPIGGVGWPAFRYPLQ